MYLQSTSLPPLNLSYWSFKIQKSVCLGPAVLICGPTKHLFWAGVNTCIGRGNYIPVFIVAFAFKFAFAIK